MLKTVGILILVLVVLVMFVAPIRNHLNGLFRKDKENLAQIQRTIREKATRGLKTDDVNALESTNKKRSVLQDEIMSYRLQSKNRTKQIQTALKKSGSYKGEIDGRFGPQTKSAIKAFQKSKGLVADGIVGPNTWEELSKYLKD